MEDATPHPGRKVKAPKAAKPKGPKPAKVPPGAEAVAAHLLELGAAETTPVLWKEAELKRKLLAPERPVLAAALEHLQVERRVLALKQGKTEVYLFAEPLRAWLKEGGGSAVSAPSKETSQEEITAAYATVVRQSGGFPDVKIAALRAVLRGVSGGMLAQSLLALWREGRATFSQGDWSLSDEATRAAAVEVNGERYLLVRLEDGEEA